MSDSIYIESLKNNSFDSHILRKPFIRIDYDGWVAYTHLAGGNKIGNHSTIMRSSVGRYVSIGDYSFLSRSKTGNYCTFGNRVSMGGARHNYNLFTSHEIAYRNTSHIYGETVIEFDDYSSPQIVNSNYQLD